jgi:hypothetical protein
VRQPGPAAFTENKICRLLPLKTRPPTEAIKTVWHVDCVPNVIVSYNAAGRHFARYASAAITMTVFLFFSHWTPSSLD